MGLGDLGGEMHPSSNVHIPPIKALSSLLKDQNSFIFSINLFEMGFQRDCINRNILIYNLKNFLSFFFLNGRSAKVPSSLTWWNDRPKADKHK